MLLTTTERRPGRATRPWIWCVMCLSLIVGSWLTPELAAAARCQRTRPLESTPNLLAAVSAVAVVEVVGWETLPPGDRYIYGDPDVTLRFRLVEVLRGEGLPEEFLLPGYLSEEDDFNEGAVPYRQVRPGGREACFAANYKASGYYLLMLDQTDSGWVLHSDKLAPVNEQLRPPYREDPWFQWVFSLTSSGR